MRHQAVRSRVAIVAVASWLVIMTGLLMGLGGEDWRSILGSPTKIPMAKGGKHVAAGSKRHDKWVQDEIAHRKRVNDGVDTGQRQDVVQNLVVKLVSVRGTPISGMHVQAKIRAKSGGATVQNLVTGSNGKARIAAIRPLPAAIDLAFAPDRKRPDGNPEWTAVDSRQNALLITSHRGAKIAELRGDEGEKLASGAAVIFASFTQMAARQTGQAVRTAVYEDTLTIAVRRNVVDFELTAPPDTRVYRPPTKEGADDFPVGTAGQDGKLRFQLDTYIFDAGKVPLRFSRTVPGGELEGVIEDCPYDSYAGVNRIDNLPPLRLTQVKEVHIAARGLDVLISGADAEKALGRGFRRPRPESAEPDGSQWWKSDSAGLWAKVRPGGDAFGGKLKSGVVERIRLVDRRGGMVGGIRVGDDWQQVQANFGPPERELGGEASYLNNGLVFASSAGKVASIDLCRPTQLLTEGTTAFVRRPPITVYVSDFRGDSRLRVKSIQDFRRYLSQMGAVKLVSQQRDADYLLSAATTFSDDKDEILDLVPLKYSATTRLTFSIRDREGRPVPTRDQNGAVVAAENVTISGDSGANFKKQILTGTAAIAFAAAFLKSKDLKTALIAVIGLAGVDALKKSMDRAVRRCPGISEQAAFNRLSDRLYDLADFRATVTAIDYQRGRLTFNVGAADGVVTGDGGRQSSVFEFYLGKPAGQVQLEEGLNADYYVAEVVSASEHSCTARVRHIRRHVSKTGREDLQVTDAPEVVRQVPDPTSGIVNGRMRVRFLPLSGEVGG